MRSLAKFFVVALNALMLSIIFTTSQTAFAQTYTFHQQTGATIVPGTTDVGNHCDDCTTLISLPFAYQLYGTTFTSANVSSNGNLQFTSNNSGSEDVGPNSLPNNLYSHTIFPYWDDLDTGDPVIGPPAGKGIFTSVSGIAPNRIFNIEWRVVFCCGNSGPPEEIFEVRLFEGAQHFDIIYGTITTSGDQTTVGVQKDNADFTQFEFQDVDTLFNGLRLVVNTNPTAADSTVSGRITTSDGFPVSGATITLSGTQSRRTISDSNGNYLFENVETNGFYTVTPSRANYSFSPASRSFSILGNKVDAVFTGNAAGQAQNPLDTNLYFVRQHYLDFLNREPDAGGLEYWSSRIDMCNGDAACLRSTRIGVSAAFFVEQEFQQTGSFVYRLYKGALGREVNYQEFSTGSQQVRGGSNLDVAKAAFADAFVQQPSLIQKYQSATTADSFVDALIQNVQQTSGADLSSQRSTLIARYNSGSSLNENRSLTLRQAIEDAAFKQAEYNKSFVLMQYFGYLRRDPDRPGYDFWLNILNNREPNNYRGMVCAFITSAEYQRRFSAVVSHSDVDCDE
jgi:hypothetical protein